MPVLWAASHSSHHREHPSVQPVGSATQAPMGKGGQVPGGPFCLSLHLSPCPPTRGTEGRAAGGSGGSVCIARPDREAGALLLSKSVPQISSCPIPGSPRRPGCCCRLYRRILWPKGKCPLRAETSSACTWSPSAKQRHSQPSCCLKLEW